MKSLPMTAQSRNDYVIGPICSPICCSPEYALVFCDQRIMRKSKLSVMEANEKLQVKLP